jgi:hypothetical protein
MSQTHTTPNVPNSKVTVQFVRDELLNCFESANREFATILRQPVTEALREQVKNFVQSIFYACGVNFDNPTKQSIIAAIDQCKAETMMGPRGTRIIQHHHDEMMRLVNRLKD